MDRLAQGVTNRAHRCTETEDQRLQDSHSQPHPRFSTCLMRGADEYRPLPPGTCRHELAAAVPPRWRWPEQLLRPRGCICPGVSLLVEQLIALTSSATNRGARIIFEILRGASVRKGSAFHFKKQETCAAAEPKSIVERLVFICGIVPSQLTDGT
jgi:hypothetical protein